MQRIHFFLACLFFMGAPSRAQHYPFIYYTPNDGLINSRVNSIKQDSKGFMYFITRGGLSVYDGARFKNYSRQNGLANDVVNDVLEITPDSFLIATNASALNTLTKGMIGIFKTADNFCPVINRFFKNQDGAWYVAADEGLFYFDGRRFSQIHLFNDQDKEIGQDIDRISRWKNFLFLTTWNQSVKEKLILYDIIKGKVTAIETNKVIISAAVNPRGEIWATTNQGVWEIDTASLLKGKIDFKKPTSNYAILLKLNHSIALFDYENNKWFYNKDSIYKFSPDGSFQIITSNQGLNATNLTDLFVDREGITWLATDGNGIAKLTNSGIEILNSLNGKPSLITSIFQQKDSTWLYNSLDKSMYRIFNNSITVFPLSGDILNVGSIFTHNKELYLVDENKILCIPDKNQLKAFQHPELIFTGENLRLGNNIIDPYGNIIIEVTKDNASFFIYVINKKKIVQQYPIGAISDQMTFDRMGRLWLITRNNQLLTFSVHPEDPEHYLQVLKDYSNTISDLGPRSILTDKENNVWIGTRYHGIYRLSLKNSRPDSMMHFTTENGLTDNFIYTLACDSLNNIWAGTQTGLDKIFLKNGHYVISNISKNNNFFQSVSKVAVTNDNTVWALSGEGSVLKISAGKIKQADKSPLLLFSGVKINDTSYWGNSNTFSFNQNNFSFSVAAPSFLDEKSIRYSYLLEGSGNKTWSEPSNQSDYNFINLSPASYTLKVRCTFPGEIYDSQVIHYPFTINPPWWQSWWFRIIVFVFSLGILIAAVRFYFKRKLEKAKALLEKQQAIEKERTRIATDMHDDLGAGLSRIKFLSETIGIKKQKDEPIEEDISKIRDYSHEMIGKMGEIVWALNEKNDSLSDLLSFTRSYAVDYLTQNDIRCIVEAPEQFPQNFVSGEFRRNIYLTVKEALHNIVKHTQASQVHLKIATDKQLDIYIQDDGIGFDKKNIRPFSNGLFNMEKRITEIGGTLNISSDKGTLVHLSVPLKP